MNFEFPGFLPVIIAAGFSIVVGFVWYSPVVLGKSWIKLSGKNAKDIEEAKKGGMLKTYLFSTAALVIMAAVLGLVLQNFNVTNVTDAIVVSFVVWLGFVATTMINSVLFDGKSFNLFLINSGYQLVALLVMGVILTLI